MLLIRTDTPQKMHHTSNRVTRWGVKKTNTVNREITDNKSLTKIADAHKKMTLSTTIGERGPGPGTVTRVSGLM